MSALDLKIPPVPLALLCGGAMWLAASRVPGFALALPGRLIIASALAALGFAVAIAGVHAFRKAATTVNPLRPDTASALVTTGVYRYSRNPMYVGLLLVLCAWAVFLAHALGIVFLPLFVAYLNRFQIGPEERALAARFGDEFAAYRRTVRRWL